MERIVITSGIPENLPELRVAAERLRHHGLIVDLECGVVRYPDRQAALAGRPTEEMIADAQAISHIAWIPPRRA